MSEHTPLTEAEEDLVEFVRTFETGEAAANALPMMLPLLRQIAARTSTATAEPCEACGDCTALVIGPNTDGDSCPWCQTCGCHYLAHAASTATADTGLRERVEALADEWEDEDERGLTPDDLGRTFGGLALDLRAALDATPASTEDRADNEGTP